MRDKIKTHAGIPELAPMIAEEILARMRGPSFGSKNVGGWKSREDLFEWGDAPAIGALRNTIIEIPEVAALLPTCRLVGWAMVNKNGSHHPRHVHGGCAIVGIVYITPGDPPTGTVFEIPAAGLLAAYNYETPPTPGSIVTFPPSVWHRVHVCFSDEPRITISFEMRRI